MKKVCFVYIYHGKTELASTVKLALEAETEMKA